jgi:hypothetical protein
VFKKIDYKYCMIVFMIINIMQQAINEVKRILHSNKYGLKFGSIAMNELIQHCKNFNIPVVVFWMNDSVIVMFKEDFVSKHPEIFIFIAHIKIFGKEHWVIDKWNDECIVSELYAKEHD